MTTTTTPTGPTMPMPTLNDLARAAAAKADNLPPSDLTETVQAIADLLVLLVLDMDPEHAVTTSNVIDRARLAAEREAAPTLAERIDKAHRFDQALRGTPVPRSPEWGIADRPDPEHAWLNQSARNTLTGTPPTYIDPTECQRVAARLEDIADDGLTEHAISPAPPRGDAHTLRHAATLLRTIGGVS